MPTTALSSLSPQRKLLLGSGVALLIITFLPWYSVKIGPFSESLSGWHELGSIAWIVLLATLAWEGARIAGVAPASAERQGNLITAVGGLAVAVIGAIFVIQRLADGYLGVGFFLGVVALVIFGYAALTQFKASGGKEALAAMQQEAAAKRAAADASRQEPPAPPAV